MANLKKCSICNGPVRKDRHKHDGQYCSQKCEKSDLGYTEAHQKKLDNAIQAISGIDAWLPDALDPVLQIHSAKPITIFSDLHFPYACSKIIKRGLEVAQHYESEILICNGDILDNNQISRHMGSYKRRGMELEDDMASAEYFFDLVSPAFKQVIWLSGNHCIERLIKTFRGELGAQRLSKLVTSHDNVKVTSRSFVDVNGKTRVCHPRQYSRNRGVLAQKLAQRWQMNIATGHQHHACMTYSPCGQFQAVDVPCMVRTDLQDYVRNECNDYPEPMTGFGMIFGGFTQVFTDQTPLELFGIKS